MWPIIRCSGVMGWRVGNQRPGLWRTSHLGGWTGEHRRPRVKAIESKTVARKTGQTPRTTIQTVTMGEQITMSMRHAAPKHTNVVTRRPSKRSSEIILAAIIYLTASCFAAVGALGFVAAIWVLWGTLGVR